MQRTKNTCNFFDKVPDTKDCNKVYVADTAAGCLAADAIINKKKKSVLALFVDERLLITRKRLEAFKETMSAKAPSIKVLIDFASNAADAATLTARYLEQKPYTLFCMSDEIVTGAMKAIQKKKLQFPDEIPIIAISNGFIPTL